MKAKFLIRMDDICPGMNWERFLKLKEILDANQIKPLIGVVPNNKDAKLIKAEKRSNFWDLVREYQAAGWTIAQHGFEHIYHTKNSGIFKLTRQAEFAGLPYERQVQMLSDGKEILKGHGLASDIFMAPSHSLDLNTLRALKTVGFKYVTDGFGLYPYQYEGLTFVPQLFATPVNFGFGLYTICLHTNGMSNKEIQQLENFIIKNKQHFLSFSESLHHTSNSIWNTLFAKQFFMGLRRGKNLLFTGSITAG